MIQVILVISLWGLFIFQPLMRSMKYAEPVLKLIFAIVLGLGVALTGFINVSLSPVLIAIALIFVLAFIATPALLNMLIKAKRYFLAKQLNMAIYWTEMGRKAMQGFLPGLLCNVEMLKLPSSFYPTRPFDDACLCSTTKMGSGFSDTLYRNS